MSYDHLPALKRMAARVGRLKTALRQVDARMQEARDGGYRGPWSAEHHCEITAEVSGIIAAALHADELAGMELSPSQYELLKEACDYGFD